MKEDMENEEEEVEILEEKPKPESKFCINFN
jgi:hypothetical protein